MLHVNDYNHPTYATTMRQSSEGNGKLNQKQNISQVAPLIAQGQSSSSKVIFTHQVDFDGRKIAILTHQPTFNLPHEHDRRKWQLQ